MDKIFQIGDLTFRLCCPEEITPPPNFMLFERGETETVLDKIGAAEISKPEYTYRMHVSKELPVPDGKVIASRPDLTVYECENGESRLIGVKGTEGYYACYRETAPDCAEITFAADRIGGLHIDPVFSSLLALERRLVKKDGRWTAQGWPVCGTSEVCHDEAFPIRAIVMLSQAGENQVVKLTPGQAFPLVYSQITVNRWNREDHIHTMDLIQDLLENVPVYHLGCTISEDAVECLEHILGV